jgi:nicotinamide-nucleotide amidase
MKAELLTIGDEILIGQIINTNSVWMAKQLNLCGIKVAHMASVADDETAIVQAFDAAAQRADFVFITGGLGPTKDDITKKTIANYFNLPLETNQEVLEMIVSYFAKRGKETSEVNRLQAQVPQGCFVVKNSHGTAPGMWLKKGNTTYISMPGVPYEMEAMMSSIILPKICAEHKLPFIYHRTVLTQGIGESALAEMIETWEDQLHLKHIKLAYLPQTGLVRLRLSANGTDQTILGKNIDEEIEKLKLLAGDFIFGYENYGEESPGIEKILSDILRERKETIALAESCTGGYVSALMTAVPGASEVFKGAIVPYNNIAKTELLKVDPTVFTTTGAVSRECVIALAEEVRLKLHSTYSIAISGIAGPAGGTAEKPVGTVWIAVCSAEKTIAKKFQFGEHRQRNITATAAAALGMMRKFILKQED